MVAARQFAEVVDTDRRIELLSAVDDGEVFLQQLAKLACDKEGLQLAKAMLMAVDDEDEYSDADDYSSDDGWAEPEPVSPTPQSAGVEESKGGYEESKGDFAGEDDDDAARRAQQAEDDAHFAASMMQLLETAATVFGGVAPSATRVEG